MNKQIEELALNIAKELPMDKRFSVEQICVETTKRVFEELAKQSEPVYYQWRRKNAPWALDKVFNSEVFATTEDSEVRKLYAAPLPQADLVAEIERLKADQNKLARAEAQKMLNNGTGSYYQSQIEELRQQLSAAQQDNEQLVKALEGITERVDRTTAQLKGIAIQALAAHKARQGKEES